MGHLERDPPPAPVFMWTPVQTMGSTYHRRAVRSAGRRAAGLAALLLALLALFAGPASAAGASTLLVEGAGDGHGVGMSQTGAYGLALHGWSYQAILAHYYTGTTLGRAPAKAVIKVLVGSRVIKLPLERYVRGVVSAEMPANWSLAALEAQAIASRTYALTAHAGGSRFDVYSDTRSQVYVGVAAETAQTNAAVTATAGQIVLYAGQPATTYFFASSGGMTESIQNSFLGSSPAPWLVGVSDPYDRALAPAWRMSFSFAAAAAQLRGFVKGSFRGIEVLKRGVSPRIVSAEVLGSRGVTPISGPELAAALGFNSTWVYFSVRNGNVVHREPDLSGHRPATGPVPAVPPTAAPAPGPPTAPQGGAQAPGTAVKSSATGGALAG
jgi:SpoIID/LytB domain protein